MVSFDQSFRLNALILKMEYSCPREESPGIESQGPALPVISTLTNGRFWKQPFTTVARAIQDNNVT